MLNPVTIALIVIASLVVGCSDRGGNAAATVPGTEVATACARLSACADLSVPTLGGGPVSGVPACQQSLLGEALRTESVRVLSCVSTAADCTTALDCIHAQPMQQCDPLTDQARCDGDLLRDCVAGVAVARDCSAEGLTCIDAGNLYCGTQETCSADRCDGDRLVQCRGGTQTTTTLCEPGLCNVDAMGRGRCLPSQEACELGSDHCEGDVAVSCFSGYVVRRQCAPGACSEADGAFCRSTGTCTPRCDGNTLIACVGSAQEHRVDCTQYAQTCLDDGQGPRCSN